MRWLSRQTVQIVRMTRSDTHKQYVAYAETCVAMANAARDQQTRTILREMAAEWLNLANYQSHGHFSDYERTGPTRNL